MSLHASFDTFATAPVLSSADQKQYVAAIGSTETSPLGPMLVSAVMLYLLNQDYDSVRMKLLLHSYGEKHLPIINERAMVGLLLVAMKYDRKIREDEGLLDDVQEVLTEDPELSFTVLCNIARTTQVAQMEDLQHRMAQQFMQSKELDTGAIIHEIMQHQNDMVRFATHHVDQSYSMFVPLYHASFFQEHASHWLLPWSDSYLSTVKNEDDKQFIQTLIQRMPLCDSDKFALLYAPQQMKQYLRTLTDITHMTSEQESDESYALLANFYVQQLYRFFRLSSFTKAKPFDKIKELKQCVIYRLIVVGKEAKRTMDELLV